MLYLEDEMSVLLLQSLAFLLKWIDGVISARAVSAVRKMKEYTF